MRHEEVAGALQEALLFLSCGHPEGFGLPLAEAIACGCLVVGYHGLAGRDFALPHMKVVEFVDLLGLLKGLEQELARFDAAPESVIRERLTASEAILQTYSLEAELDCGREHGPISALDYHMTAYSASMVATWDRLRILLY